MERAPSVKIMVLITLVLFAVVTYGAIKIKEALGKSDDVQEQKGATDGNLALTGAVLLALFLLIFFVVGRLAIKKPY